MALFLAATYPTIQFRTAWPSSSLPSFCITASIRIASSNPGLSGAWSAFSSSLARPKTNLLPALLLVIVPTERFERSKRFLPYSFLAITWVSMASWQWIVEQQLGRQMVLHNPHNLDPIVQIKAILAKPWSVISIIWTSIRMNYLYYFQTQSAYRPQSRTCRHGFTGFGLWGSCSWSRETRCTLTE